MLYPPLVYPYYNLHHGSLDFMITMIKQNHGHHLIQKILVHTLAQNDRASSV